MHWHHQNELEQYIASSYEAIEAYQYEVLFLHVDLRAWGFYANLFETRDAFMQAFLAPLLNKGITLIIPTFSYTASGEFHIEQTPTHLGAMNKWFLKQAGVVRSAHPMFSFAALGPQADKLKQSGKSAFGVRSVYDIFKQQHAAFVHIGIPLALGNTCIHWIEFLCGASYRYQKVFRTKVFEDGKYLGTDYSVTVRKLDNPQDDFKSSFQKIEQDLFAEKLVQEVGDASALMNISVYPLQETANYLIDRFYDDPSIFIKSNYRNYE